MSPCFLLLLLPAALAAYTPFQRQANQEALIGAFHFNGLSDPVTVQDCGSDDTQIQIYNFVGYFLQKADTASMSQVLALEKEFTAFISSLPAEYQECMRTNEEVKTVTALYGIDETTTYDQIRKKVIDYALGHFLATKKVIHAANLHWNQEGNYYQAGFELAELGKKALTLVELEI